MNGFDSFPVQPIKLYRYFLSGHSHRIELFLSLLKLPYELVDIDLVAKAHKQQEFLTLNPFGQVPVIQDGDITLADSNAILVYLASNYDSGGAQWLPCEPIMAASVQRWLSVAAGPLAFGPAAARRLKLFVTSARAEEEIARAKNLFDVMENHLKNSLFLVGDIPTIADIANYTYTAYAPEGDISLDPYPVLRGWLQRIESMPGFIPMAKSPLGLACHFSVLKSSLFSTKGGRH